MSNIGAIEKRDQEVKSSLVRPTMADRDRRELLSSNGRLSAAMREALSYLKVDIESGDATSSAEAAYEALTYGLEQE